ncbi:leukocyte immunoglobulin-like receptor subfamily B member 1, partial [Numida meleagris]|uniref:leukocyte immunoglobulin-like receptor subfamily B member 1 n=1 Tax=Numida meleagris TaxID=8996 RepID=UPI000B3DE393
MQTMALALILVPRPSLSLHPSQGVSVGDNVTLQCHLSRLAARVWLYQDGGWTYRKSKDKKQDAAEFSFVSTSREHAGTYRCQYRVSESAKISEKSDPVELVVTDHSFLPPSISLHTKECVGTGTNVTIWCRNKGFGATFLLHKDGHSAPVQHQESNVAGTATFTLFGVTPADTGTYQCSYRPWRYPFVSSPLGSSVTLEVAPTPAPPDPTGATFTSHGNLVVVVAGGCTAAFVFILILVIFFFLAT